MAIKAGNIITQGREFVIDRLQSAGPGNLNIPEEKIYELGNYESVATVRDIPDLSFDMESLDVSCEIEALLTGVDPSTLAADQEIDLDDSIPMDIISPFKSSGAFAAVRGIALPYLTLESSTYRFGVGANGTQSHTMRGDSIFYIPGTPRYEEFTNTGVGPYSFDETAIVYNYGGKVYFALSVMLRDSTTGAYKRLVLGDSYSNTSAAVTLSTDQSATYDTVCVTYGTATIASYTQNGNNPNGNPVHENVSTKVAAVRATDVDVYVGSFGATPVFSRWTGVQSFEVTRSVSLENDEEFGNTQFVDSSYDVAEVSGSIVVKALDASDLWDKIHEVTNVPTNEVIGPFTSVNLPVELRVTNPDTGDVEKTFYMPSVRFTPPSTSAQVQSKLETTFSFNDDLGKLYVYNGER